MTHKTAELEEVGRLHIEDTEWNSRLSSVKEKLNLEELCYLSTCNRVEFFLVTNDVVDFDYLNDFVSTIVPDMAVKDVHRIAGMLETHQGEHAVHHILKVASSVDSMVIGEREIITQVRNAYEKCRELGLTGDLLRILFQKTIQTAKSVYTKTSIAKNPVSVVTLAYRRMRDMDIDLSSRIVVVGTGVTNKAMTRFLKKHGYSNFTLFNRTVANATEMGKELEATVLPLSDLPTYTGGFDVLLTCTAATERIITPEIYSQLAGDDTDKKLVIDLALPGDFDPEICGAHRVNLISMMELQEVAKANLESREAELDKCEAIIEEELDEFKRRYRRRQVELAMQDIPKTVHEIRKVATEDVFAKELSDLDLESKEVLEKVIDYLEKKYISVPMKMAKEILLEKEDLR